MLHRVVRWRSRCVEHRQRVKSRVGDSTASLGSEEALKCQFWSSGDARSTQMNHAEMQFLNTEFPYKKQYGNFIGGKWVAPVGGEYFDNISPITGEPFTSIPRSREADIELALDAAHKAKTSWGKTSVDRSREHPEQDRRSHRSEPRAHRGGRNHRQRQAATRNDGRRHSARHRPLPLLRELRARAQEGSLSRDRSKTPSRITSMNRSAWSARSFRGISRS